MKDIAYDDLVKILSEHNHDPVLSSIVQRYKFYNRSRKDGESIANFLAEPREIKSLSFVMLQGDTKYDAERLFRGVGNNI